AVIRGYSLVGANIGMGHFCKYAPAYHIDKEADILMYSRSNYDGLHGVTGYRDGTGRDNRGDGYFVSMYLDLWCNEIIRGNVVAYNMTDPYAPVKYLPIQVEDNYTSVLFSTGRDYPEDFQVFVEFYDYNHVYKGLRQFVHYYDHLLPLPGGGPSALQLKNPIIPSVTHMYGYPHNFNTTFHHALMVHLDYGANAPVYYRVIEKYVDANGNPIRNDSGFGSKESSIRQGLNYNGVHEEITDYIYKGYKLDNPPNSSSDYTAGEPIVQDVNGDIIVYFVYAREYTVTEKYVDKNGNPLVPPVADTTVTIQSATPVYTKTIPEQNGYKVLGYFIGDPFIGEYTQDAAVTDHPLSDDMIIYFVYQKTTTLTVSKEVAGDYANRGKVFNFTVYFEDSGGKAPVPGTNFYYIKETGGNTAENGTLTVVDGGIADFSLAHGQKIIISGVDADGRMRIAEDEYPYYDASFADSELGYEEGGDTGPQMRDMTPDRVFDFTNERVEVPETGLDTGRLGAGFILPVSALSASLIFLAAKAILRRRGRKSRFFEK
ncbi:MAG: hypothetical protein FWF08_04555, partial [Oscillospiraceae bacterium]|nr:hypothetical protein [Oscillospiraceae bacterium]